jgi:cathepsin L
MAKFGRQITDAEEMFFRATQFAKVHQWIEEHNASGKSWIAGHNQFSDWSFAEYKAMLGYVHEENDSPVAVFNNEAAASVNWVTDGAVTPVKDQGQCGSCWAFSSTGALEGAHYVASKELLSFSEQQLVDCAGLKYGNLGCNGGMQNRAFNYYKSYKAELETVYKYTSGTTKKAGSCEFKESSTTAVDVSAYTNVKADSPTDMKQALTQQPLAVSIEADKRVFQTYKSGIMDSTECGTTLDHAVLAVGYGTENGQEYWLVKNSWNTTWGDQGYIKLAIVDGAGICGVQMGPLYPTSN